jgi:hypothetical protein
MHGTLQILRHRRWLTGVTALGVVLVLAGAVAAATASYSVKVNTNPNQYIAWQTHFKVTATGVSAHPSQLTVYLMTGHKCAGNAATEATAHGKRAINARVSGRFSKTATVFAKTLDSHVACAFLSPTTSAKVTRAHGSRSYEVTDGIY